MDPKSKFISEIIGQTLWVKENNEIWSVDLSDIDESGATRKKSKFLSPDRILAPMPGKITKIFVSPGQEVDQGDTLLVMEAMKMEYTLKSGQKTSVDKILVTLNQQVSLGELLVQLKLSK